MRFEKTYRLPSLPDFDSDSWKLYIGFVGDPVPLNDVFGEEAEDVPAIVNDSERETEDVFECKVVNLACE